jgi:hypothetical protein
MYIRLLTISAFLIAMTGASFSIFGLAKLFAGASTAVVFMAAALEFTKLVVTGFLYRYWGHINRVMRTYLTFAVCTLVCLTSVGIFGFLSNAYMTSSVEYKRGEIRLQALNDEKDRVEKEIQAIRGFIDSIPRKRISKRLEFQQQYEPEIRRLQRRAEDILVQSSSIKLDSLKTHAEVGPAIYLAQAFNLDIDVVVKYLIILFVSVFDPLAVCLVFCLNLAIRLNEKYRGNELKIAAHSITTPVDHRFRKAG